MWKHKVYRDYLKNGETKACTCLCDYIHVHYAKTEVSKLISESKDKYYNKFTIRLNNLRTSSKTYWSIIKTFYNCRKIPTIPPLLKDGKQSSPFDVCNCTCTYQHTRLVDACKKYHIPLMFMTLIVSGIGA